MKLERDDVFERLEPPAGGLDRLRAGLDAERERASVRGWQPALAAAALVAVAVLAWGALRPAPSTPPMTVGSLSVDEHPALQRLLGVTPREAVTVPASARGRMAVLRVPTEVAGVDFYLVAQTSGEDDG